MTGARGSPGTAVAVLLLAALVAAAYGKVASLGFLTYDDPLYVTENEVVRRGLSPAGIAWAFVSFHASNWHPLTWISHMLDVSLAGLSPAFHHLSSAVLHAANAVLLLLVLRGMTGHLWRSALAAALFAVHPLNVESVAWVAERKNILSLFFLLLTLLAHQGYVRRPSPARAALTALLLAAAVMAKPMAVTAPLLLLCLDYWPLGRRGAARRALAEKAPLVLIAALAGLLTILAQRAGGSVVAFALHPLPARAANALVSYAAYLGMTFWPSKLAVFYPHPGRQIPAAAAGGAALLLAAATWAALGQRRRRPWLAAGWCWYLIGLLPMIGLLQVGAQARADRYAYLPLIGIFVALSWGLAEVWDRAGSWRPSLVPAALATLALLAAATRAQTAHWRDSVSLFSHAAEAVPGNWLAENNLGTALARAGRTEEAAAHYREALRLLPTYRDAARNLRNLSVLEASGRRRATAEGLLAEAQALEGAGRLEEALERVRAAVAADPSHAASHGTLGILQARTGDMPGAARSLQEAVRLAPADPRARFNLGLALRALGRPGEAAEQFREAARLDPADPEAAALAGAAPPR